MVGFTSDQHLGYVDFDMVTLVGSTPDNITHISTKKLGINFPKQTQKYRVMLEKKFQEKNLLQAAKNLRVWEKRGRTRTLTS